jgi:hypothetical protein
VQVILPFSFLSLYLSKTIARRLFVLIPSQVL